MTDPAITSFTADVERWMETRGISRSELARRLEASPAYVTKILRGDTNFTLASMAKLAEALEVELRVDLRAPARAAAEDRRPAHPAKAASTGRSRSAERPAPHERAEDDSWRAW